MDVEKDVKCIGLSDSDLEDENLNENFAQTENVNNKENECLEKLNENDKK